MFIRVARVSLALFLLLSLVTACGRAADAPQRVRLATTTSTENSGLLAHLLPPFEQDANLEIQVIAVGTGKALKLGENGDADILLVHARDREDAFIAAGFGSERRDVMWNDFVLLGPRDDPAGVRGTSDPAAAFAKILAAKAPFITRGDDSGTHIRETSFWKQAGVDPTSSDVYFDAGQGMGACLTIADEKRAYLLADRGTWLAHKRKLALEVLVQGDASLRNPYGVVLIHPGRHPDLAHDAARRLADYLTSDLGQERIAAFRKDGEVLFHPATSKGAAGD